MPTEYTTLVEELKKTSIPFEEYGWKYRPDTKYGITSCDFESDSLEGDGEKLDAEYEASVDIFLTRLSEREQAQTEVEEVLKRVCGSRWWMNSCQFEQSTNRLHIEWVCVVKDTGAEDEDDAVQV